MSELYIFGWNFKPISYLGSIIFLGILRLPLKLLYFVFVIKVEYRMYFKEVINQNFVPIIDYLKT